MGDGPLYSNLTKRNVWFLGEGNFFKNVISMVFRHEVYQHHNVLEPKFRKFSAKALKKKQNIERYFLENYLIFMS